MITEKEFELMKKRMANQEDGFCYHSSIIGGLFTAMLKQALKSCDGGKLADLLISKNDKPRCIPIEVEDDSMPPPHKARKLLLSKEESEERQRLMSSPLQIENTRLRRLARIQAKELEKAKQGAGGREI